jgi:putative spermidine/putrescine transport system permease protein
LSVSFGKGEMHSNSILFNRKEGDTLETSVKYVEKKKRASVLQKVNTGSILLFGGVGFIIFFLLTPIVVIPILSFGNSLWFEFPPSEFSLRWYQQLFSSTEWLIPVINSFKIAIPVVVLSLIVGIPISYAIIRGRFKGRSLLDSLFSTPMLMPNIIFAIGVYSVYLSVGLNGTFIGIIMAHVVIALPFVITNVSNSLRTVNLAIEQAALSCGANPLTTFFKITLPLIKNGVIAGAVYAFFISWDEVIIAIFITTPDTLTLPMKIWNSLRLDFTPLLAAVATLLIVMAVIFLTFVTLLDREGTNEKK